MSSRIVELRKGLLERNDLSAQLLRERFAQAGTQVVNLLSSPGSGKTTLLHRMLEACQPGGSGPRLRAAALVGDCATDNDARRLAESGAPVRQIVTEGCCHLEADMVSSHLEGWDLEQIDLLFVENVGNLVCPADYDLGESLRMVLLAVTEGEDKPLKYPQMFHTADLVVLTKLDLAGPAGFDQELALGNLRAVRPDVQVLLTSARTGAGIPELLTVLTPQPNQR
jgi:hydrogenase nickel incorporation protein HypB